MSTFPHKKFGDMASYADAYYEKMAEAAASVNREQLQKAADILTGIYSKGGMLFSCGNGGSAAIANHLVCDHSKLVRTDTDLKSRIVSLSATVEIITAIGNDISYDEVFVYQLRTLAQPGDALVTVSSSGDSENIVRAAQWARDNGLPVISMTGFAGGRSAKIADVNLHVTADNYGVIEDVHQSLMHILAQYVRQAHMDEKLVVERKLQGRTAGQRDRWTEGPLD
ncbi:MAG TPA: SIS domain-containing protein [Calditrichia bacterium]|nr:SIS domain-containing protein [Calditrichia bacterium]